MQNNKNFNNKNPKFEHIQRSGMRDQLKNIKKNKNYNTNRPVAHTTAVTDWVGDGVDHINVSSSAATPIGRFMSYDNTFAFVHPKFGRFASSRSFWLWLKSKERDDRLRTRVGTAAFNIYRSSTYRQVPNARAIMLDSDYQKLKQYPEALKIFMESELPLDSYTYGRGDEITFPRRPSTFYWMVEGWEEIRRALKEEREPDFSKWLDVAGSDVYDFVFSDDGSKPEILTPRQPAPMPKHFRNNTPQERNHRPRTKHVISGVVDIQDQNKTADLENEVLLKKQVHVVDLTKSEIPQTVETLPSDTVVVPLIVEDVFVIKGNVNNNLSMSEILTIDQVDINTVEVSTVEVTKPTQEEKTASVAEIVATVTSEDTEHTAMANALRLAVNNK